MKRHLAQMTALLERMDVLLILSNLSPARGATSSLTDATASGGDGSAKATTGLTARDMVLLAGALWTAHMTIQGEPPTEAEMMELQRQTVSYLASAHCANGGSGSQPRPSGAPPGNSHGECCAPTPAAADSAPTMTTTRTVSKEEARTAADRLSSMLARYGPTMLLHEELDAKHDLRTLRSFVAESTD